MELDTQITGSYASQSTSHYGYYEVNAVNAYADSSTAKSSSTGGANAERSDILTALGHALTVKSTTDFSGGNGWYSLEAIKTDSRRILTETLGEIDHHEWLQYSPGTVAQTGGPLPATRSLPG